MGPDSQRGFALLEVLVAFAIAALALAAVFGGTLDGLRGSSRAARMEEALAHARSHLAALGRGQAILPGETETDDGGGYRVRIRATRIGRTSQTGGHALFATRVTILWQEDGRTRSVTLDSQRLAPAGPPS